eukprot:CAMPEP_0114543514 /NCGR_PEP_ID=MMETSP0114-20121206/2395_1 /TAXON_ID=31324 /ORGANISM="Goniomonas sp, Strain m" /LENGTH=416 /DNA_ID=CAMNT_0001727855 /DNA_START=88 /DNA_END=1335 /DNA_ORIENTATION=+
MYSPQHMNSGGDPGSARKQRQQRGARAQPGVAQPVTRATQPKTSAAPYPVTIRPPGSQPIDRRINSHPQPVGQDRRAGYPQPPYYGYQETQATTPQRKAEPTRYAAPVSAVPMNQHGFAHQPPQPANPRPALAHDSFRDPSSVPIKHHPDPAIVGLSADSASAASAPGPHEVVQRATASTDSKSLGKVELRSSSSSAETVGQMKAAHINDGAVPSASQHPSTSDARSDIASSLGPAEAPTIGASEEAGASSRVEGKTTPVSPDNRPSPFLPKPFPPAPVSAAPLLTPSQTWTPASGQVPPPAPAHPLEINEDSDPSAGSESENEVKGGGTAERTAKSSETSGAYEYSSSQSAAKSSYSYTDAQDGAHDRNDMDRDDGLERLLERVGTGPELVARLRAEVVARAARLQAEVEACGLP